MGPLMAVKKIRGPFPIQSRTHPRIANSCLRYLSETGKPCVSDTGKGRVSER